MHIFDYSFLREFSISSSMLNYVVDILNYNELTNDKLDKKQAILSKLSDIAIFQSVKNSNEIEGIKTTDKRIKEIVLHNNDPITADEKEIAGYKEALNFIHTDHANINIREDQILNIHKMMLSKAEVKYGGKYKTTDNLIVEYNKAGDRFTRFVPTPAKDTPRDMDQLVLAYLDANSDYSINQLLLIPCFILDFFCIHPFEDGNGRVSRLLTLLLLYHKNFDVIKYISLEQQINESKDMYYKALKESSIGWDNNSNNYEPFIKYFLMTLWFCYNELHDRFENINSSKGNKRDRVTNFIVKGFDLVSKKDIQNYYPDISVSTIEQVLSQLLKDGVIYKTGTNKDAKYRKK